jgi:hypothetical protein
MKQIKMDSRRGFESRQVHHKHIAVCIRKTDHLGVSMFSQVILQYAFDGPALVIDWVRSIEVDSSGKQNP